MRPDEKATNAIIQRQKRSDESLGNAVNVGTTLATTALGATGLAGIAGKVAPFLSEYLTEDLAYKGIKKVAPKLGSALETGMKEGLSLKSGLDFIKENFSNQSKPENKVEKDKNIISQYSPELFSFIQDMIGKGVKPLDISAKAKNSSKFDKEINKLEMDHKATLSQIIQELFKNETVNPTQNQQSAENQNAGDDEIIAQYKNIMSM